MTETIKSGQTVGWKAEATCVKNVTSGVQGCNCVFAFSLSDVHIMHYEGTHFNHYYATVDCPECRLPVCVNKYMTDVELRMVFTPESRAQSVFDDYSLRGNNNGYMG